jgi:hypothetical protein
MFFDFGGIFFALLFLALLVWSLYWKGLALWKAARAGHRGWFVALVVINTIGILDILYLYIFSKKSAPVGEKGV